MAKIIKFNASFEDNQQTQPDENHREQSSQTDEEVMEIKKAVEEHILANFAVKNVLGMDIIYKINKNDLGVIGRVAYEHKRREGTFIADFIAKGGKIKDRFFIDTLAFEAGEPELYQNIVKILKAKKALPNL